MAQGASLLTMSPSCRQSTHCFPCVLQDHNRRCLDLLEPFLRDDKRAMKYLRREAERGIGIASAGPGGLTIDWD